MENFEILTKNKLSDNVNEYVIYAPATARHCLAGQFVILRTDKDGERVPFTICDYSRENGTISLLVQEIGYTTMKLAMMREGDRLADLVGPLGNPTDLSDYNNILLVAGGIGAAVVYPQSKKLLVEKKKTDVILGARNEKLLMFADRFGEVCDNLYLVTDDGSRGKKGFVTDMIKELFDCGRRYDAVLAVGPLPMMRGVCALTKQLGVKTIVSMNSLMVDGTGMCGCCRLSVGGEIKYACIDGPEFDGHLVDFEEAIERGRVYKAQEEAHYCRLRGEYGKD